MEEVAVLIRASLPQGASLAEFGEKMNWGRGSDEALKRIDTITKSELCEIGLTTEMADGWAIAYEAVSRIMPHSPSAKGRAALMLHVAALLAGE